MNQLDIVQQRLQNQYLSTAVAMQPGELVAWLGAVQSQDYAGAKWALGMRLHAATDSLIEQAFDEGAILRTHVLRPTWHFVAPADIGWMLALSAPRVHALNAYMYRKLELDPALLVRSDEALANALRGGSQFTRSELAVVLEHADIPVGDGMQLAYLVMHAELEGLICSGGRRGKQFTYALLAERAPHARHLERDEALAELVRRYFFSHGPATLKDFVWWSGLTMADARNGIEAVRNQLLCEDVSGATYWFTAAAPVATAQKPIVHLLPNYDEYGSYADHSATFDVANEQKLAYSHLIVLNGRVAGTWRRVFVRQAVEIETSAFVPLAPAEQHALAVTAEQYSAFLGVPVRQV